MKWNFNQTEPCASCPYHRDAPLAFWDKSHFDKLLSDDKDPFGPVYDCHETGKRPADQRTPCVGWLMDQQRRAVPCFTLRMSLAKSEDAADYFVALRPENFDLYTSIEEMVETNYPGGRWRPNTRRVRRR